MYYIIYITQSYHRRLRRRSRRRGRRLVLVVPGTPGWVVVNFVGLIVNEASFVVLL